MIRIIAFITIPLLLLTTFGCENAQNPVSDIPEKETTTGVINGKVQSNVDETIYVKLLQDGKIVAQAEGDGGFTLRKIEAGDYTLRITAQGFHEIELSVTVISGETVSLHFITLEELAEPVSHIIGLVRNNRTGIRLPEVVVRLTDNDEEVFETMTSDEGIFNFENIPASQKFTLTIEHADYEKHNVTVDPIPVNETKKLNIKLTPEGIDEREIESEEPGEGLPIFTIAPDFKLPDGNNKTHKLFDYLEEGKNVVIVFYIRGS